MEVLFCQSCSMPLKAESDHGTNKDGSRNQDYCSHCYQQGQFANDFTMDQMIDHCAQFLGEFNKDSEIKFTKEQAIAGMKEHFPTLKRWAQH